MLDYGRIRAILLHNSMDTVTKQPSITRLTSRIADTLRHRIESGQYRPGDRLPPERDLTTELRVHRKVIRNAVALLEADGMVVRRPNCRPVVNAEWDAHAARSSSGEPFRFIDTPVAFRQAALIMWQGCHVHEQNGTAQQRIFWGMNEVLSNSGVHTIFLDIGQYGRPDETASREAAHLRHAVDNGLGVVYYPHAIQRNTELIRATGRRVPLVLIDRQLPGIEADFVGVENDLAVYEATNYLIEQGHRRIAFATLTDTVHTVQDRQTGYARAIADAFGLDRYELVIVEPATDVPEWPAFDAVFSLPPNRRPTALVCVNDYVAVRAYEHLRRFGLEIPRDIALVGFDNLIPTLPGGLGLTTVAQPYEEIGRRAAMALLDRRNIPFRPPVHLELPCRLLTRTSSQHAIDGQ